MEGLPDEADLGKL